MRTSWLSRTRCFARPTSSGSQQMGRALLRAVGRWLLLALVSIALFVPAPFARAEESDLDAEIAEAQGLDDAGSTPQAISKLQALLSSRPSESPEDAMATARVSIELAAIYERMEISPMAIQLLKTKALELSTHPAAEKMVRAELALLYDRLGFGPQALRERSRIRHIRCP